MLFISKMIKEAFNLVIKIIRAEKKGDTSVSYTFTDVTFEQADAIVQGIKESDTRYKVSSDYNSLNRTLNIEVWW